MEAEAASEAAEERNTNFFSQSKTPERVFLIDLIDVIIIVMDQVAIYSIIISLSSAGFLIVIYIRHHKNNVEAALVCPLRANCDLVIHSNYSKFLGIPVELLGLLYYLFVMVIYTTFLVFPKTAVSLLIALVHLASITAFAFSAYLTMVQAFAIKNWCTWCLISAAISVSIFFLPFIS